MAAEKNHKEARRKRPKIKIVWVLVCVVVLFFLVIALLPWFVSSEMGRRIISAKINDSMDGEVGFASLSMGWFKGVRLTDVSFRDSAGQISVAVNQVTTRPRYGSILKGHSEGGIIPG
jgi:autotransporter translocation and assembly factor TamB